MKNTSRILPYALSQKLSEDDLQNVAAAGGTMLTTNPHNGTTDLAFDVS